VSGTYRLENGPRKTECTVNDVVQTVEYSLKIGIRKTMQCDCRAGILAKNLNTSNIFVFNMLTAAFESLKTKKTSDWGCQIHFALFTMRWDDGARERQMK